MLTLRPGYARLDIDREQDFATVSESIRSLLHICRLNNLPGGLIASRQHAFDWRSSLRIGIRYAASRESIRGLRLALVAEHFNDGAREDVLGAASSVGIDCRIFRSEDEAIAWLAASGGGAPAPEEPRQ